MAQTVSGLVAAVALALGGVNTEPAEVAEWWAPTPTGVVFGDAAYYGRGYDMAEIADRRGLSLEGLAGGVALMRAGDLGRVVWLYVRGRWRGPFRAVDCSQRLHYAGNVARGRAVDLAWDTWANLGLWAGPWPVVIRFGPPWAAVR